MTLPVPCPFPSQPVLFACTLLHLQLPVAFSAPKATKRATHYTALLPSWAVLHPQQWERNRAQGRHGESSVSCKVRDAAGNSRPRGMPSFEVVTMVGMRQVMDRRGKQHSTVQSTAVQSRSNTCSKCCVVRSSWPQRVLKQLLGAQCWLWPREGRKNECSTGDKVGLGACWWWTKTAEMCCYTAYQLYLKSSLVHNKGKVPNLEIKSWLYLKATQTSAKPADENSMTAAVEKANI